MKINILVVILALFPHFVNAQNAQLPCGETETVFKHLKKEYNEEPIIIGRTGNPNLFFVIFQNNKDKEWTLTSVDNSDRITCILATGKGIEYLPERLNTIRLN